MPKTGTAVLNADDPLVARMARHCAGGRVVYFSMATEKGSDGWDRVDGHCGRGGAAFVLQPGPEGELIVLRLGPRTMPVVYTHLIPATFGGKARMNVANALAAAAAAWAAGAHLHDIRQGLRTFTTSFFQAPGRLNLVELGGIRVVIDYCHNVDGMRQLADFVRRMVASRAAGEGAATGAGPAAGRAIGVIGIPGDRRDATSTSTAPSPRGRSTRSTSARTATCAAARRASRRRTWSPGSGRPGPRARRGRPGSRRSSTRRPPSGRRSGGPSPGDLVVCCVDDAVGVYRLANELLGAPGAGDRDQRPGRARRARPGRRAAGAAVRRADRPRRPGDA